MIPERLYPHGPEASVEGVWIDILQKKRVKDPLTCGGLAVLEVVE